MVGHYRFSEAKRFKNLMTGIVIAFCEVMEWTSLNNKLDCTILPLIVEDTSRGITMGAVVMFARFTNAPKSAEPLKPSQPC